MAYKLKPAESKDLDRLIQLYRLCYPTIDATDEDRYNYFMHNARADYGDFLVVKDRGQVVGSLLAYHFVQYQEGVEIPVIGIANVMVAPEVRREGVAGFMMEEALNLFEEEGAPASILYPFEHRFYRHLGWGYGGEILQYQIETAQLDDFMEVLDEAELSIRWLTEDDLPRLMQFYEAQARLSNGMLQRQENYWREKLVAPPRETVLAFLNGDLVGYLIYSSELIRPDNLFAQEMIVHEWLAANIDGRDTLLSFIARQKEQVKSVRLSTTTDEPLHLLLENPAELNSGMVARLFRPVARLACGWMYRLVDAKAAFDGGRPFNGVRGDLLLEMEDEILGDRKLVINFTGQGATVDQSGSKTGRKIRGPVDMVSQLYCGYLSAGQAFAQELIEFEGGDTVEFCQHAFSQPPPRYFDLF